MTKLARIWVCAATAGLTFILAAGGANAQETWTRQSPYPADYELFDIHFVTEDLGWIAGDDDILMFTTDGGATWQQTPSVHRDPQFYEDPIYDVHFVDELHGFAFGNYMFRTIDGGATWQELTPIEDGAVEMDFLSPTTGYVISSYGIYRTTDAGDTWTSIWDWRDFNPVTSIDFIDENVGWVTGVVNGGVGVFKTTDGGQSFTHISNAPVTNIIAIDSNTLLASSSAEFHRSTDGGVTWTPQYSDNTEPVNGVARIARIDDDSFAAVGTGVRIWVSDDSGLTWSRTQDVIGSWGGDWDIQFPTAEVGYAAGALGIILKTTDGGHSWTQISHGAAIRWEDIVMRSSGTGIAVGDFGTIVRTTDFGQHWVAMQLVDESGIANLMNAVEAIDADSWIAVGEFGVVFRSDDDGASWQLIARQPVDDIFDISFLDGNEGWSFGYRSAPYGFITHTTDGGQTWTFLREDDVIPFAPTVGQVMPSGRGWGLYPQTIHAITDDGFDQTLTYRNLSSGDSWQSMEYATDNVGWYGGFFGGLLRTNNGGYIFQSQALPGFASQNGDRLLDVRALSDQEAYASTFRSGANFRGTVYKTTNGGTQWTASSAIFDLSNQGAGALNQIDVLPSGEIWVTAGSAGFIWSSGIPDVGETAALIDLQLVTGSILGGTLADLDASDDSYVHTRSGFDQTFVDLHHMEMRVTATTTIDNPANIDLTIEDRIDQPAGIAQIRLRNWNTNAFDLVGSYGINQSEQVRPIEGIDATQYVNATGQIEVSIKHIVFVPFLAFQFESFIDQLQIVVE